MTKENYNWWNDPDHKEKIDRISWWTHAENKETFNFPISVIKDGEYWVATCNDETKKLWGDELFGCTQGKTKQEAIEMMFKMIKFKYDYSEECRLNYERFVPFRSGNWKQIGGTWITIFGVNINFRYGNGMKGGWYMPFTKLNISLLNEWKNYRKFLKDRIGQY